MLLYRLPRYVMRALQALPKTSSNLTACLFCRVFCFNCYHAHLNFSNQRRTPRSIQEFLLGDAMKCYGNCEIRDNRAFG